jgi:hypothetical protein
VVAVRCAFAVALILARVDFQSYRSVSIPRSWSDNALRNIGSFEDALALAAEVHGSVVDASQVLGDGFALLRSDDAKRELIGKPMLLLEWKFNKGDYGDAFVSVRAVVQERNKSLTKVIFNDGSTGVAKMLHQYQVSTGRTGGLVVRNGFRESTYNYCPVCGSASCELPDMHEKEHKQATTYYLDTSL